MDAAVVQQRDPVAQPLGLLHEVGDEQRPSRPMSRTDSISFQVSRRACGSRPVVSSSRIATCGRPISASAIDSRCFWPPDSLAKRVVALLGQPQQRHQLVRVGRIVVEGREQLQRLADGELVGKLRGLQLDPDALAQFVAVRGGRRGRAPRSCPESGVRRPPMHSTVVVLPAPLGPRIPKISPRRMFSEIPSTATVAP